MIQHEALPLDPDHEEVFEVPEGLQLGVSAYIKLFQHGEYIGEAAALDKIPHVSHAWELSRVMFFREVEFKEEITVTTLLLAAEKLCYLDNEGWVIMSFRDKPLQETNYTGTLSKTAVIRGVASDRVTLYEHIGFVAKGKGESL